MQRRNSMPALVEAAAPKLPAKRSRRRHSTSGVLTDVAEELEKNSPKPKFFKSRTSASLADAEQESEKSGPKPKFCKSKTSSSLAGGILAGAPGNALRRAFKRLNGKKSQTADLGSLDEEYDEEQAEIDSLKEQSKRIKKLYTQPSQLSLPVWHDSAPTEMHESDFAPDTCEVGMVRLVYSKVRSLRESKDYDNVYKRNSWKDLVGDLRHGIRVCLKVQGFINLLLESSEKRKDSPCWAANPSLEKQRVWMELLNYIGDSETAEGKIPAKELENYRAMIKASAMADGKCTIVHATPEEWAAAESAAKLMASPTNLPTLMPRPPNTTPPAKCSPVLSKRAVVCQHGAADSDDTKLSPPV